RVTYERRLEGEAGRAAVVAAHHRGAQRQAVVRMPGERALWQEYLVGLVEIDQEDEHAAVALAVLALPPAAEGEIQRVREGPRDLAEHGIGGRLVLEDAAAEEVDALVLVRAEVVRAKKAGKPAVREIEMQARLDDVLLAVDLHVARARVRIARHLEVGRGNEKVERECIVDPPVRIQD